MLRISRQTIYDIRRNGYSVSLNLSFILLEKTVSKVFTNSNKKQLKRYAWAVFHAWYFD